MRDDQVSMEARVDVQVPAYLGNKRTKKSLICLFA